MATPLLDLVVTEALAGERLDRAIPALCADVSRMQARRMIEGGSVFVEGRRTGICSRLLRAGQRLTCYPLITPRVSQEPRIVLTRDDLWIVDKPAGMAVEPTRSGSQGTLTRWLEKEGGGHVTHRLDAPVSGLVVVARTKPAQAALNRLFAAHAIDRRYLAAVAPAPDWDERTLEETVDGKPALTTARVTKRAAAGALLEVQLATGRFRQIRRHLAGAGSPVIGDREQPAAAAASRILLHAYHVSFNWKGETVAADGPPPEDFNAELGRLELA